MTADRIVIQPSQRAGQGQPSFPTGVKILPSDGSAAVLLFVDDCDVGGRV